MSRTKLFVYPWHIELNTQLEKLHTKYYNILVCKNANLYHRKEYHEFAVEIMYL